LIVFLYLPGCLLGRLDLRLDPGLRPRLASQVRDALVVAEPIYTLTEPPLRALRKVMPPAAPRGRQPRPGVPGALVVVLYLLAILL
jgi:hypothetical protein